MKIKKPEFVLWVEGFGFGFLVAFVWLTEALGVPHFLFSDPAVFNWGRPLLRTVVVLGVWLAVHLATRRLLKRLHHLEEYLRVCAWCRKIGHEGEWMTTEEYFGSAFTTKTTHGMCPECSRQMASSAQGPRAKNVIPPASS